MKLKCKKNTYPKIMESESMLGTNIHEDKSIPNLTVGNVYEVIFQPETPSTHETVAFYNDKKVWQEIVSVDVGETCECEDTDDCDCENNNLITLSFFEPVE